MCWLGKDPKVAVTHWQRARLSFPPRGPVTMWYLADGMYPHGGGGGPGRGGGGGRRHLDDMVEGKLFLGGMDPNTTQEAIESYCQGWYGQLVSCSVPCPQLRYWQAYAAALQQSRWKAVVRSCVISSSDGGSCS